VRRFIFQRDAVDVHDGRERDGFVRHRGDRRLFVRAIFVESHGELFDWEGAPRAFVVERGWRGRLVQDVAALHGAEDVRAVPLGQTLELVHDDHELLV
jgi:hypothetical protein